MRGVITPDEFQAHLSATFPFLDDYEGSLAVAVSGGPDSMALLHMLHEWAAARAVHALIVDHGLRPESAQEAQEVAARVQMLDNTEAHILRWDGRPDSAIQEQARNGRYDLMQGFCSQHKIPYLFVAHHLDDQAETVLFRLAKGSGLDGLSAMRPQQNLMDNVTILRPLLDWAKADLLAYCEQYGIEYVSDPTNNNNDYARPRLRAVREALEREGMTNARLSTTAKRVARAREALDFYADEVLAQVTLKKDTKQIVLNIEALLAAPEETRLRVLKLIIADMNPQPDHPVRMEKLEALAADLWAQAPFRKRTLAGLILERDDKNARVIISHEK